jgi:hypothetical protein
MHFTAEALQFVRFAHSKISLETLGLAQVSMTVSQPTGRAANTRQLEFLKDLRA